MTKNYSDEFEFISIVIPSYNRFHYLKMLVDSIHKHADTPFELIIHDDNSNDGTKSKTWSLNNLTSTIIYNNGFNFGLAESINRAVKIAGSNYILMLNADCRIEKSCFKDIINTLKCPFVGLINLLTIYNESKETTMENDKTKFRFLKGIGAGCISAFRKDAYERIGKWNNTSVSSSNADVSFACRVIKNGYFIVSLVRNDFPLFSNLSSQTMKNKDSTIPTSYDCSYPKLFNCQDYEELCQMRSKTANDKMQISYRVNEGETNINYWDGFSNHLIDNNYNINWGIAKKYNHYRWKSEIEKYIIK